MQKEKREMDDQTIARLYILIDPFDGKVLIDELTMNARTALEFNRYIESQGDRYRWIEVWYALVNEDDNVLDRQRLSSAEAKQRNDDLRAKDPNGPIWSLCTA